MGTEKRARQKSNRDQKLIEIAQKQKAAAKKKQTTKWALIIAAAIIGVGILAWNYSDSDTVATTVPSTTALEAPASTTPAAKLDFVYGSGECAPADGSAPKTQKFTAAPAKCIDPAKTYIATIETTKGTYKAELDAKGAPGAVNNFVNLARFHYFDDISCHRVMKDFMAQCGDPTGTGGGGPGYSFADELPAASTDYKPGTLAMANSGKNTNGSQFFTMFREGLQPNYTIFGKVIEGMDTTVAALNAVGNPADGPPTEPVSIKKVTITES